MTATGARPIDRDGTTPLWRQIHTDLLRRVRDGEFAHAFPGELAVVAEYGVSRHTVREALRRLREDGVVTAERGRTPRLADPAEIDQPLGTLYSLFDAVRAVGQTQRSVVRALDQRRDAVIADRLGLARATPLLYLERLRLADEQPLALDRVWLSAKPTASLLDADFTTTALYDELRSRCGIRLSGGSERLRAVVPTSAERRLLAMTGHTAAFAIERLARTATGPIEWRHTLVRGDRFTVQAEFPGPTG